MSFNPLDIYARAARRLKLTPGERAALKTADTLLLASLAGAAVAVAQAALAGGAPLSFATLEHVFVYALATALLTGVAKLFRASGDAAYAALGSALSGVAERMQPPQALVASQAQRLARLRAGGGDATTRPVPAASVASSAPRQPQASQPSDEPPATPAPSQRVVAPSAPSAPVASEDDEENGPPTVQLPVVRPGATPGATPPTAPASPSAWLNQAAPAPVVATPAQ